MKYYVTPMSWDRGEKQYVADIDDICNTVQNTDWYDTVNEALDDCDYLGEFSSISAAFEATIIIYGVGEIENPS